MRVRLALLSALLAFPATLMASDVPDPQGGALGKKALDETDRKVMAGHILLKWGGYVERVEAQDRRAWAARLWPTLAGADLYNLQKASKAVTYEGMRNALLGQRPYDDQIIDLMAKSASSDPTSKVLGSLAADLVFTPVPPCRIVDTRNIGGRITANSTRDLNAANPGGNFSLQGGDAGDCGIPANPAALALSVTGLNNTATGYLRVYPFNGTSAQGSPVPLNAVNTTATNDIIVPTSQGVTHELKVFSTADTHYAAFVTGYFMAPQATAVQCNERTASATLAGNDTQGVQTTQCPVGYGMTGGGCTASISTVRLVSSRPFTTYHFCFYANEASTAATITAYARCCRVPGR